MTTDILLRNLEEIQARALKELGASSSSEAAEHWRVAYLGRRGELTQVLRSVGSLAPDDRRAVGAAANLFQPVNTTRSGNGHKASGGFSSPNWES